MSRPPRVRGLDYRGLHRYFLTFCTRNRIDAFRDAATVDSAMLQFRRTRDLEQFVFLAYCVMPDHVHFLLEGITESADFRRFVKLAKQPFLGSDVWSIAELFDGVRRV